jgi:hypothetical protein
MPDSAGLRASASAVRRVTWLSLLVLVAAPLFFYAAMVLGGKEPPAPDTMACRPFSIWGRQVQQEMGRVPDWYPFIMAGMPSYGSYTYTPRSPFNPIALAQRLCDGNRGAFYWILFSLAGLTLFAFLRRQGFTRPASVIAALLFSMTPYFPGVVAAGHSTKLEALCLLPAFLLALDMIIERPGAGRAAFLAGAVALLAWANHPQVVFYGLVVGFLYGISVLVVEKRVAGRGYWLRLAGYGLAAAALAAGMATEPFLAVREYAPWSIRGAAAVGSNGAGAGWDYATAWSFHPRELVALLFPGWFGLQGETYWGPMPFTQSTHYFGVAAVVLAVFGLARARGPRRWIWGGISLFVLFVGFGRFLPLVYGPMYHLVPFFNRFRVPSMIYSVLPLCLAFPVAAGLDALLAAPGVAVGAAGRAAGGAKRKGAASASTPAATSRSLLMIGAVLLVLWAVLALGAGGALSGPNALLRPEEVGRLDPGRVQVLQGGRLSLLQQSVAHGMIVLLLGLGVLALRRVRAAAPWIGLLAGIVIVGDVVLVGRSFYHVEPRAAARDSLPLPRACDFLARQPGTFRILPWDPTPYSTFFRSNAFGLVRLESIGGYQTARLRAYADLLDANLISRPAVLSMLNVRFVLSPARIDGIGAPLHESDGFVYPWPDSLPRAWAVRKAEPVAAFSALKRRFESDSFRPGETALVYPGQGPSRVDFASARVTLSGRGPGSLRLRVDAEGDAFVVVSEMTFPPGWTATVDGRPATVHRVDHVLMGVEVPAGGHDVAFTMRAPGRLRGTRVSRFSAVLTLALAAAAISLGRISRRRPLADQSVQSPPAVK